MKTIQRTQADGFHVLKFTAKAVDKASGVLTGVTVAESGVPARGHFIMVGKDGKPTNDPKLSTKRLQVMTDDETLSTLMSAAAKAAGGKVKSREDHNDSLACRLGYLQNFRFSDDKKKVIADLHFFPSYARKDLMLEAAKDTPELLGLSMDFAFGYDVKDGMAYARVKDLYAVDMVDDGAVTPDGLFRSRQVDTQTEEENQNFMSKESTDEALTTKDVLAALAGLTTAVAEMGTQFKKFASKSSKKSDADADSDEDDEDKKDGEDAEDDDSETMKKEMKAMRVQIAKLTRTRESQGFRSRHNDQDRRRADDDNDTRRRSSADNGREERERFNADDGEDRTFEIAKREYIHKYKMTPAEATRAIVKDEPELHARYLINSGVITERDFTRQGFKLKR